MTDLWSGAFGNEYTTRNAGSNLAARQSMWEQILPKGVESILEVGANVGGNLEAIARFSDADLYACEPNASARELLKILELTPERNITGDYADKLTFPDNVAELAFTCGVLIHIPTDKLIPSMREIHRVTSRYIVCAEYFAPSEEMVPYRGHNDALWRRDYGSLWLDNFSDLRCMYYTFLWKRWSGLDNLTVWVFEKGPRRH